MAPRQLIEWHSPAGQAAVASELALHEQAHQKATKSPARYLKRAETRHLCGLGVCANGELRRRAGGFRRRWCTLCADQTSAAQSYKHRQLGRTSKVGFRFGAALPSATELSLRIKPVYIKSCSWGSLASSELILHKQHKQYKPHKSHKTFTLSSSRTG